MERIKQDKNIKLGIDSYYFLILKGIATNELVKKRFFQTTFFVKFMSNIIYFYSITYPKIVIVATIIIN